MAAISAGVAEVGTVPGTNYVQSYFQAYPRDERFANVSYVQFNSIVSLDSSNELIFTLPSTEPPVVYDISDVLIKLQVKITCEDGKAVPKGTKVIAYVTAKLK